MPRASVALPDGFTGTRPVRRTTGPQVMPGQVPLPYLEPHYWPSKGGHFAARQIIRHPQAIIRARRRAAEWLAAADPRTAPSFPFMAEFWRVLDEHIRPRGEMAVSLRHNHY